MDKVTVSRAAIALVERGLIERAPNAGDRRSHLLRLTTAGQALYEQVAPKALELERRIFGGFDADRVAAFMAMLRDIDRVALAVEANET
jgi:DNA-binding MarR family transcriptional regulator